jgi:REP element-mobilizing transposase RayT
MSRGSCGAFGYLISPASALPACYCPFILSESRGKPVDPGFIVRETSSLHERYDVKYRNALPNHFHLALWPVDDGDLSRWMHWLLTTHVRRYLAHYHGSGHVWQGRFKAFPIEEDEHLRVVLRSIERNALRASLSYDCNHECSLIGVRMAGIARSLNDRQSGAQAGPWPLSSSPRVHSVDPDLSASPGVYRPNIFVPALDCQRSGSRERAWDFVLLGYPCRPSESGTARKDGTQATVSPTRVSSSPHRFKENAVGKLRCLLEIGPSFGDDDERPAQRAAPFSATHFSPKRLHSSPGAISSFHCANRG